MTGLDRVRPRSPKAPPAASTSDIRDSDGKRALFSVAETEPSPAFGSVTIECAKCGEPSVLSPGQGLRALVPSVHFPFVKRDNPSYMKCPACAKFTWVRVSVHF